MHDRLKQTLSAPADAPDADLLAAEQALAGRLEDARKRQAEAAGAGAADGAALLLSDDPSVFEGLAAKERAAAHEAAAVEAALARIRDEIAERRAIARVRAADKRLCAELEPLAEALEKARQARELVLKAKKAHDTYLGTLRAAVGRLKAMGGTDSPTGKLDELNETAAMMEIGTLWKEGVSALLSDFDRRYAVPAEMLFAHHNEARNRWMAAYDGLDLPAMPGVEAVMARAVQREREAAEHRAEQAEIMAQIKAESEPKPAAEPVNLSAMRMRMRMATAAGVEVAATSEPAEVLTPGDAA